MVAIHALPSCLVASSESVIYQLTFEQYGHPHGQPQKHSLEAIDPYFSGPPIRSNYEH